VLCRPFPGGTSREVVRRCGSGLASSPGAWSSPTCPAGVWQAFLFGEW